MIAQARYVGRLVFTPLFDGRLMELVEEFGFIDPAGLDWPVPKGTQVDGASIPQALWSLIGSPFTGLYRDASVIHDYHCDLGLRTWRAVHRVFYDAMIVSGVSPLRAKVMYAAVYYGGPRWTKQKSQNVGLPIPPMMDRQMAPVEEPVYDPLREDRDYSIRHTPLAEDVMTTVEVNGTSASTLWATIPLARWFSDCEAGKAAKRRRGRRGASRPTSPRAGSRAAQGSALSDINRSKKQS